MRLQLTFRLTHSTNCLWKLPDSLSSLTLPDIFGAKQAIDLTSVEREIGNVGLGCLEERGQEVGNFYQALDTGNPINEETYPTKTVTEHLKFKVMQICRIKK